MVVVYPICGEKDDLTIFFLYEISKLVLTRCELFRIEVHAYTNCTSEFLVLVVADFDIFETWPFFTPELISVVEMGLFCIENEISLPITQGSRVV